MVTITEQFAEIDRLRAELEATTEEARKVAAEYSDARDRLVNAINFYNEAAYQYTDAAEDARARAVQYGKMNSGVYKLAWWWGFVPGAISAALVAIAFGVEPPDRWTQVAHLAFIIILCALAVGVAAVAYWIATEE